MNGSYTLYMHVLKENNKKYIGITKQKPIKRWQRGLGYTHSTRFYEAIKKYGWDAFEHIILENNLTKKDAAQKEIKLIRKYKSNDKRFGFNSTSGGFNPIMSEEQKIKISNTEKGKKIPKETIEKTNKSKKERYIKYGLTEKQKRHFKNRIKPVLCLETGLIYNGQKALKQAGFNPSGVGLVCNGKRKTSSGYHWKFVKGDD